MFNLSFSLFGFFLYFLLSFNEKSANRAAIESLIAFIAFFVVSYIIRWMAGYALAVKATESPAEHKVESHAEDPANEVIQNLQDHPASIEDTEKVTEYVKHLLKEGS
ncbi:hypothetical protein [Peribacillus saganii]|uniref:hypothetical protein n=1 Tax=Peribacillus saganii TaxID=2303992 RepID=UPI00115CC9D6|nr:hypothetical protein [Peribacillus saganii]